MAATTTRLLGPPEIILLLAAGAASVMEPESGSTASVKRPDSGTATTTTILESKSGTDQPFINLMDDWLGVPFIDLMHSWFDAIDEGLPLMGLTENCSPTFLSTGDPCLDFFFQVVPDTPTETINSLLAAAWDKDPLTALKLVFHLRGVRGTGKSDRKGFYTCALWLHENHPKTLALNADMVAEFGYMKDLPELLHRLVSGPDARKRTRGRARICRFRRLQILEEQGRDEAQDDYPGGQEIQFPNAWTFPEAPDVAEEGSNEVKGRSTADKKGSDKDQERFDNDQESSTVDQEGSTRDQEESSTVDKEGSTQDLEEANDDEKGSVEDRITRRKCRCRICRSKIRKKALRQLSTTEDRLAAEKAKVKIRMDEAANLRRHKRAVMAARAIERYASDNDYRLLHDRTSDFFAALLSSDLRQLKSSDTSRISLAAKWCPSLCSSYDRSTLLCESIARRVFPLDSDPEYSMIEEHHYVYRVRRKLEKEVLVPLRRALELPEVYISAGQWGSLPYSRVASVAMKNYKKLFKKHDPERFHEYLSLVREGKAKIAAGALLPHEILASVLRCSDWYGYQSDYNEYEDDNVNKDKDEDDEVAELQWRRMVSDLSEIGKLSNCIAVCDVSGSMSGTPMEVCIALGLLLSELSEDPWKGRVITFSENPVLHQIKGDSLKEKAQFVKGMDWGANTNFQLVFDQILAVAVEGKLEAEKMIKKVFVFSDMEFDEASGSTNYDLYGRRTCNNWETDYQVICRKFEESGYGSAVPEIVFWNLRDSRSTPVPSGQKGVALVSGFSKNLMKVFLESDGTLSDATLSPKEVMETAISGEEYTKLKVFD